MFMIVLLTLVVWVNFHQNHHYQNNHFHYYNMYFVIFTFYDMLGRDITQLVNTTQEAGFKAVQWDATDSMGRPVSAGVYLYQIQAGEFVQTRKMVLLK